ncbi:MAG: hypothetical protein F4057_05090 [Acidobacteria bacterium]|nr:hypothetical protein [Acidobacteriota bacterium]
MLRAIGNALAEGWSDPSWQNAGVSGGRTRAAIQTRARSSMAKLCALLWLSQITAPPQYGDDISGGVDAVVGVFGSRTSSVILSAWCLPGSRIGM